jgi:hypothetical protein
MTRSGHIWLAKSVKHSLVNFFMANNPIPHLLTFTFDFFLISLHGNPHFPHQ